MTFRFRDRQFLRFAVVGVASNAILYVAYLALTSFGTGEKLAMTIVYLSGVVQTFAINRSWTFSAAGRTSVRFVRYCLCYAGGYVVNLLTLHIFVDLLHFSHQIVQGAAVIAVALLLFVLQKFWVFRQDPTSPLTSERS